MMLTTPQEFDRLHALQRRALLVDLRLTIDRDGILHLRAGDRHDMLAGLDEADALITAAEAARRE